MRVVSWNTHHGGVPVDVNGKNKPFKIEGITSNLITFNPDYIALQELEQNDGYGQMDQLEYHRAALQTAQNRPWYSTFAQMGGGAKSAGIGIGLLASSPLTYTMRRGLFGNRPFLSSLADFGYFAAIHSDPDSAAKRSAEFAETFSYIYPHMTPQLICGDFNAVSNTIEMSPWVNLFSDAWVEATKIAKASSFKSGGITHGAHRIDYMFYHGLKIVSADVPDTSVNGIFPSDHHPLVVEFK